jgi:hypothetical protein
MTEILKNRLPSIMEGCKESIIKHGRIGYGVWVEIEGEKNLSVVGFDKTFRMNSKQDFYDALSQIGNNFRMQNKKILAAALMIESVCMDADPVTGKKQEAVSLLYVNLVDRKKETWFQTYTKNRGKAEFGKLDVTEGLEMPIMDHFLNGYKGGK